MAREYIGNSANLYFMPVFKTNDDNETPTLTPMAELVLITIEPGYRLDDKGHVVKNTILGTERVHISLQNLDKCVESLQGLSAQLKDMAIKQEQAGADPDQLTLDV